MEPLHYKHWPKSVPHTYNLPQTSLYYNLEVSAERYPAKTAISYYGTRFSYERLKSEVDTLAGYLQKECDVKKGDRVLLYMQNSPQFIIAYYAILRADAVIVPANPMNLTEEMRHYVKDAGTSIAICGAELSQQLEPLTGGDGLTRVIVASYADYVTESIDIPLPEFLQTTSVEADVPECVRWEEALAADCKPGPHLASFDDLAAIIYTSGTTGLPKGCMHTHETLMVNTIFPMYWQGATSEEVLLGVVPFFHVTGMQLLMNASVFTGAELVIMTRWDRVL